MENWPNEWVFEVRLSSGDIFYVAGREAQMFFLSPHRADHFGPMHYCEALPAPPGIGAPTAYGGLWLDLAHVVAVRRLV
jgi:hypothetical protein